MANAPPSRSYRLASGILASSLDGLLSTPGPPSSVWQASALPLSRGAASVTLDPMPPLEVSAEEFHSLAERFNALATDFLASLDDRRTVSATSAIDTAAFDLP